MRSCEVLSLADVYTDIGGRLLAVHGEDTKVRSRQSCLEVIADELNDRPCAGMEFLTPHKVITVRLSDHAATET